MVKRLLIIEKYNSKKYTASNTLKLGTYTKVTNPENGKSVYVKINDRLAKYNKDLSAIKDKCYSIRLY